MMRREPGMLLAAPDLVQALGAYVRGTWLAATVSFALAWTPGATLAAASDVAQAEAARKKPLQRCDQLKGNAELECLKKARERIVEARKKRESSGKGNESKLVEKTDGKEPKGDAKEPKKK